MTPAVLEIKPAPEVTRAERIIDNMDYTSFIVGERVMSPGPGQVTFDMSDSGGTLAICMARPTGEERRAFKAGLSFKFAIEDQIIFLLVRMGKAQWMDAPYYRWRSPNLTQINYPNEGEALAIHAMLIDAATGILCAQKLISPSTEFSQALMTAIAAQPEIPDYDARLNRIFATIPTSELVRRAVKC